MNLNIIDELKLLNFVTTIIKIIDKCLNKIFVNNNLINIITKRYRRIFNDDLILILSINFTNQMFIKTINISIIFAIMIFKIMIIKIKIIKTIKTIKNIDQIKINFQTSFCLRRQLDCKSQSIQLSFQR